MDPSNRILCPVQYKSEELYVAGSVSNGVLDFWVERPAGKRWMHITEPSHSRADIDAASEVVALTAQDDGHYLARIAMMSGWFARTGREVLHPPNESNEIWAVTETCRQMFMANGTPIASAPTRSAIAQEREPAPAEGRPIYEVIQGWMAKLNEVHVTAVVLTVPDPFSKYAGSRLVVAAYPETLRKQAIHFEVANETEGPHSVADWRFLDDIHDQLWSPVMQGLGFKTVVALRIPVAQNSYLECLMFGPNRLFDNARAAISAWTALNVIPQLKEVTATAVCNLTARERECLISAFHGKTAVETADELECTPRTVRFHLSQAMQKLRTNSTMGAIRRAQMLCII